MRKIFPFSYRASNIYLLLATTMSYISFPILALLTVHTACLFMGIEIETTKFSAATAFLIVGIYSLIGTVVMYVNYFVNRKK